MKILVVDDHALFRDGLSHVLQSLEENVNLLEAPNSDIAIQLVSEHSDLDLVLLDLNMPGKDGFEVLETFTKSYPATPVVILSASTQREDVQRALDAGAVGFIGKDTTSAVMLNALRLIFSGGVYTPPGMAEPQASTQNTGNNLNLTPRQSQVLAILVKGGSNKLIASELNIAEATVKMHITSILKSLGVTNRTQAALATEKLGLLTSR